MGETLIDVLIFEMYQRGSEVRGSVGLGEAVTPFQAARTRQCRCAIRVQTCDSARAASCRHSCALLQLIAGSTLVGASAGALCAAMRGGMLNDNETDTHTATMTYG